MITRVSNRGLFVRNWGIDSEKLSMDSLVVRSITKKIFETQECCFNFFDFQDNRRPGV